MSEAERANYKPKVFLKQVKLKNYKSILEVEAEFKLGLNLIIGNNGSGKTNFLNYLYDLIEANWRGESIFGIFTLMNGENSYEIRVDKRSEVELILDINKRNQKKAYVEYYINGYLRFNDQTDSTQFVNDIISPLSFYTKIIQYGTPKEQAFIDIPIQFTFSNNGIVPAYNGFDLNQTQFFKSIFYHLSYSVLHINKIDELFVKTIIEGLNIFFTSLKEALVSSTEIKGLRVSPNFNLYSNKGKNTIDVANLCLEFNIYGSWIPYSNLSDGNKRLFYILSEILSSDAIRILRKISNEEFIKKADVPDDIILLEEPELGIHPHQLHKLMLFIKEQAKEKQIILTTHSPQVLNILDPDELDRIIICSYDQEKGTQLRHLTERQIKKGQMYMQDEGFLSDYWVHSDLEPAD